MVNTSNLCYDSVGFSNNESPKELSNKPRKRQVYNKSGLLLESVRLDTFAFWNPFFIDAKQLARSGFYYTRTLDRVQCALCNGTMGQFTPDDEVDKEHWRHFNHKCPFIKGEATGNVPMMEFPGELQHVYKLLQDYYMELSSVVSISVSLDKPMFPNMLMDNARMKSFGNWPKNAEVDIYSLADAGFFSVEAGDLVQCFHCGGCLFNWLQGDDPVKDHAQFYPNCKFIQKKTNTTPKAITQQRKLTGDEANLLLHHPIAVRLMEIGVLEQTLRDGLKSYLEKNGVLPRTVTDAMNIFM